MPQGIKRNPTDIDVTILSLINDLSNKQRRECALFELTKLKDASPKLASYLWNTRGTMAILLKEVCSIYNLLENPALSTEASIRACNSLALMQAIAASTETRPAFILAQIPVYLYPILNTTFKSKAFEYLRLTSLGIIGELVKNDNPSIISFILSTEIVPLCLRIMETGNEHCKTIAIFIVQKILHDSMGLNYICLTQERYMTVIVILNSMLAQITDQKGLCLLRPILKCYYRLAENKKAVYALRIHLPEPLKRNELTHLMEKDSITKKYYQQLMLLLYQETE